MRVIVIATAVVIVAEMLSQNNLLRNLVFDCVNAPQNHSFTARMGIP